MGILADPQPKAHATERPPPTRRRVTNPIRPAVKGLSTNQKQSLDVPPGSRHIADRMLPCAFVRFPLGSVPLRVCLPYSVPIGSQRVLSERSVHSPSLIRWRRSSLITTRYLFSFDRPCRDQTQLGSYPQPLAQGLILSRSLSARSPMTSGYGFGIPSVKSDRPPLPSCTAVMLPADASCAKGESLHLKWFFDESWIGRSGPSRSGFHQTGPNLQPNRSQKRPP